MTLMATTGPTKMIVFFWAKALIVVRHSVIRRLISIELVGVLYINVVFL
jgi:hypothetical protein